MSQFNFTANKAASFSSDYWLNFKNVFPQKIVWENNITKHTIKNVQFSKKKVTSAIKKSNTKQIQKMNIVFSLNEMRKTYFKL